MSDRPKGIAPLAEARLGRILKTTAKWLAYFGGVLLTAAAIMTIISIAGRAMIWAGFGPIPGDFELVELSVAVAVFSFLPWSQINRGQVTVDVLVDTFPPRVRAGLGMAGDTAMAIAASVIAWRMWLGMGERIPMGSDTLRTLLMLGDKPYYTETTFILRMPVWYGYALSMIGAAFFALVCIYTVWRAANWTIRGQEGPIL
ncbi:MAG: hypothetical protein COA53_01295 [Rhodobacteraceae bacterium]|nr:MAG: hypothetical protein COA53_01295 [Paracoccaceae bacterium]